MMKLKYKNITVTILYLLQFRLRCFFFGGGGGGGGVAKLILFLVELGRHIKEEAGESNAYFYCIQRISVALQQRNLVTCIHGEGVASELATLHFIFKLLIVSFIIVLLPMYCVLIFSITITIIIIVIIIIITVIT